MKSYLKFLSRNKLYTAIEAVGLVVSLAFVILIGSYVRQQWQVAHGAPEWKHYYVVGTSYDHIEIAPTGLPYFLKENLPGVEYAARYGIYGFEGKLGDDDILNASLIRVNPDYFKMFPVEWVSGDPAALEAGGIAVSEAFANRYATEKDILEQTVFSRQDTLPVVAVYRSLGAQIFLKEDLLEVREDKTLTNASTSSMSCIISTMIPEDELVQRLDQLFEIHLRKSRGRDESRAFVNGSIERMDRLYFSDLNSGQDYHKGNLSQLQMLLAVVLLLLLSAVFNYINLSAALAGRRAKEMGIRAILGSSRGQIMRRYLAESLLFTAVCAALAVLLAHALTPLIHNYIDVVRSTKLISAPFHWEWNVVSVSVFVLFVLVVGLIAGWVPARISSRFNPSQIVKGDFRLRSKRIFSKVFIIFQTALAVMLIAFSLVMERQFSHMIHRPLGANPDRLYVQFHLSDALDDELGRLPFVSGRGHANGHPGQRYMTMSVSGKKENELITISIISMDTAAFRLCEFIPVVDYHTPSGAGTWLSESTFKRLSEDYDMTSLPQDIYLFKGAEYAGVLSDFALSDAAHVNPTQMGVVIVQKSVINPYYNLLKIEGDQKEAETVLQALFIQHCSEAPQYAQFAVINGFLQDKMRKGLEDAERNMRLIELFMILAVLVSLLGLLAMSSFYASEQTHDVAVRKVFGSTVREEVTREVREYMLLVGIACVLAIPVAVWLSGRYLQDFVYRISGYGWIFAVAVVIALLISFLAVLWQTLKAARTDPAVELKKE